MTSTTNKNTEFQLEGMTMAITNMEEMVDFYTHVFQIDFEEKSMFNATLYQGQWATWNLLFCPAVIAGNTAQQNRHQFDVVVPDLDHIIQLATHHHGSVMGDIIVDDGWRSVGIYDPDRNSILFKQRVK